VADVQIDQDAANIPAVNLIDGSSDPSAPGSGHGKLYLKDGVLSVRLPSGDPLPVGGSVALAEGEIAVGDAGGILASLGLGTEGDVVTADAAGKATWATPTGGGGGGGAGLINVPPWAGTVVAGGALVFSYNGSQWQNGWWSQAGAAQNDQLSWSVYMEAGTWNIGILTLKGTNVGIQTWKIDGTTVLTYDAYAGGVTYNQIGTATGISIATSGLKTLSCTTASKNGSSSAYVTVYTGIYLMRTA